MTKEKKYIGMVIFGLITYVISFVLFINTFLYHISDGIINWNEVGVFGGWILSMIACFITGRVYMENKR